MPIIEIASLVKRFGATTVLDGVDLDVAEGEVVAIIGRSGSARARSCAASTASRRSTVGTSSPPAFRCSRRGCGTYAASSG